MPIPELMAGWQRFKQGRFREQNELFERVAREGQRPSTAMIACCDSRVDPAILFDCDPGSLFLVRNIANLVPPHEEQGAYHGTSAAIEFAVVVLGVQHLVVLGHSRCGGIRALLDGVPSGEPMPFLEAWIRIAEEAKWTARAVAEGRPDDRAEYCAQLAVGLSLRNLHTFPAVRSRVDAGKLQVHGWYFDLHDGELSMLDQDRGRFVLAPTYPAV